MENKDEKNTVGINELVRILRSKNAGPVYFGFDLIFKDRKGYELGKKYITREKIAALYQVGIERVSEIISYDPGMGIKINIRRNVVSGDPGDSDVFGCQQHVPLMGLEFPLS